MKSNKFQLTAPSSSGEQQRPLGKKVLSTVVLAMLGLALSN